MPKGALPNEAVHVRSVSLKPQAHPCGGEGAEITRIFDNLISVQV
jgi:hypothetical protein